MTYRDFSTVHPKRRTLTQTDLFLFGVRGVLAAELTVFVHFKLLFDLFLVALGVIRDIATLRALELGHVVFDTSHSLPAIPYIYNVWSVRNFSVSVNTQLL